VGEPLSPGELAALARAESLAGMGGAPRRRASASGPLADLGPFWPQLLISAGLTLVVTLWLSLATPLGAVAFGAAAAWQAAMLALWGIIGGTIAHEPRTRAKMALAIGAVASKLLLFALAIWLVAVTLQVVWDQGLALYVVAGLLAIPVISTVTWFTSRRLANRLEQTSRRRRRPNSSAMERTLPRGPIPSSAA
jgi:hypothetical protein